MILVFKDVVSFPETNSNIKGEVQYESGRENICLNTSQTSARKNPDHVTTPGKAKC